MQEENEARRQIALEYLRQVFEAYHKVFGQPGDYTPYGKLILQDLERKVLYRERTIARDKAGRYDGGSTAYNLGLHDVVKFIHSRIEGEADANSIDSTDG